MADNRRFDKVVILANDVDRLGGIGRFMNQMAVEFFNLGYEVELVGVTPPPKDEKQVYDRPSSISVRTLWDEVAPENWTLNSRRHKRNILRRRRFNKRANLRVKAVNKLNGLLTEWGPRTVIICTQVLGMEHIKDAGYVAHDRTLPRIIGQYHGSFEMCAKTGDLRRVVRAYSEIDKFVCLNGTDAELFRKASLNNSHWIPNPVAAPNSYGVEKQNLFVAVSRYDKQKSLEYLLRAWKLIANDHPDWRVELYGEGVLRSFLESVIELEDIPRAFLMGMSSDVGAAFAPAKVHVLSSQYEGLPIAIVEAAMVGVPTIAFDCAPGISDLIIDGKTGAVVRQNSVRDLASAMKVLATDQELLGSMSEASIEHSSKYQPTKIISHWLNLFEEIAR
jgi:glycosyltransferase involved in cell wall biosynthesis